MNKAPLKGMKDFLPEEMRVRDYVPVSYTHLALNADAQGEDVGGLRLLQKHVDCPVQKRDGQLLWQALHMKGFFDMPFGIAQRHMHALCV